MKAQIKNTASNWEDAKLQENLLTNKKETMTMTTQPIFLLPETTQSSQEQWQNFKTQTVGIAYGDCYKTTPNPDGSVQYYPTRSWDGYYNFTIADLYSECKNAPVKPKGSEGFFNMVTPYDNQLKRKEESIKEWTALTFDIDDQNVYSADDIRKMCENIHAFAIIYASHSNKTTTPHQKGFKCHIIVPLKNPITTKDDYINAMYGYMVYCGFINPDVDTEQSLSVKGIDKSMFKANQCLYQPTTNNREHHICLCARFLTLLDVNQNINNQSDNDNKINIK